MSVIVRFIVVTSRAAFSFCCYSFFSPGIFSLARMATGLLTPTPHRNSTFTWSSLDSALASSLPSRPRAPSPAQPAMGGSRHHALSHSAKRSEAPQHSFYPALFGGGPSSPSRVASTLGDPVVSHARSFTTQHGDRSGTRSLTLRNGSGNEEPVHDCTDIAAI